MPTYYNTNVSNTNLLFRFVFYYVYVVAFAIYKRVQAIMWKLTGVDEQLRASTQSQNYATSAHVCRVFAKYKFDVIVSPAKLENFFTVHETFVHPCYVLADNVTLYTADENQAVFVEVDKDMLVWQSKNGTFFRDVQYTNVLKVITMPFASFQRLASEVGQPKARLILIGNISRCGSILTSRFFEETGKCVVIREADALNVIADYAEYKPAEVTEKIAWCVVALLCKPIKSLPNPAAYVCKLRSEKLATSKIVAQFCPDCRIIFCYRNAKNASVGLHRLTYKLPLV